MKLAVLTVVLLELIAVNPADAAVGPGSRPNILVVLTDDQDRSAETIAHMPYLSSRAGWYRFDTAFVNNATCCPSRATFLSGQWSHHTGVEVTGQTPRFDDGDTIATRLDAAGYRTGWFGKYHLGTTQKVPPTYVPPGWDQFVDHERNNSNAYYDYTLNDNGTAVRYGSAPEDYSTDVLADKTLAFVQNSIAARAPFFAVFAPQAPHNPWTPAPRHLGTYAGQAVSLPPSWNEDTSDKPSWWAQRQPVKPGNRIGPMRKEWETLLAVDEALRALHRTVQQRGVMKDTVIVFTTDNGYAFGEHRWKEKRCVYDACARVPLYLKYGGRDDGAVFEAVVGNEDYAATFAELAGVEPPSGSDGQSMIQMIAQRTTPQWWEDEALLRSANPTNALHEPPDAWGLRTSDYLYAETTVSGEVELYDLAADPWQLQNVAADPSYMAVRVAMDQRLTELRARE